MNQIDFLQLVSYIGPILTLLWFFSRLLKYKKEGFSSSDYMVVYHKIAQTYFVFSRDDFYALHDNTCLSYFKIIKTGYFQSRAERLIQTLNQIKLKR